MLAEMTVPPVEFRKAISIDDVVKIPPLPAKGGIDMRDGAS